MITGIVYDVGDAIAEMWTDIADLILIAWTGPLTDKWHLFCCPLKALKAQPFSIEFWRPFYGRLLAIIYAKFFWQAEAELVPKSYGLFAMDHTDINRSLLWLSVLIRDKLCM